MSAAVPFPRILRRGAGAAPAASAPTYEPGLAAPIPEGALRELAAMQVVLGELLVLDGAARERVLMWVCQQLAVPLTEPEAPPR